MLSVQRCIVTAFCLDYAKIPFDPLILVGLERLIISFSLDFGFAFCQWSSIDFLITALCARRTSSPLYSKT